MKSWVLLSAMLPFMVRADVHVVPPDWSGIKTPYVEEPVLVKVGVDGSGVPNIVESAEPLPDNVVQAIQQSRFDDKEFNGKAVGLTIQVRRSLADGRERVLMPDWNVPEDINELRAAKDYAQKDAALLEKKAEHAPGKRVMASLLVYYSLSEDPDPALAKRRRKELIGWFVENEPAADLLGSSLAIINTKAGKLGDPSGFEEIASRWKALVAAHPDDAGILDHAIRFLAVPDANGALAIIKNANRWGRRMEWAGRVYALRAMGATSVDLKTGEINFESGAVDPSSRQFLLSSGSLPEVLSAMWTLDTSQYSDTKFCPELLAHVRTLYPQTLASCPAAPPASAKRQIEEAKLEHKVEPRYPEAAKSARIAGVVNFQALVDKNGNIVDLEFKSGPLVFYRGAREAVLRWHYTPRKVGGQPQEMISQIAVHYSMSR